MLFVLSYKSIFVKAIFARKISRLKFGSLPKKLRTAVTIDSTRSTTTGMSQFSFVAPCDPMV